MTSGRPQRERVVLAHRRGARMVRTRVEVQEQTEVGDALVRGLVRAQLGLALRLAAVVMCVIVAVPLARQPLSRARIDGGVRGPVELAGARGADVPAAVRRRPAVRPAGRAGRARLHPRGRRRTMTDYPSIPLTATALLAAAMATVAVGVYGGRLLAHHVGLPRGLPHGRRALERRGDIRRIPLGGIVSRRRGLDRQVRRRRAVVSGRLHRRLSGTAAVRRRAAAPLGRIHRAGLRRLPAGLGATADRHDAVRRRHLCALPRAAVPGRGPDHRTSFSGCRCGSGPLPSPRSSSATWSAAGCAPSRSFRRSSTG